MRKFLSLSWRISRSTMIHDFHDLIAMLLAEPLLMAALNPSLHHRIDYIPWNIPIISQQRPIDLGQASIKSLWKSRSSLWFQWEFSMEFIHITFL